MEEKESEMKGRGLEEILREFEQSRSIVSGMDYSSCVSTFSCTYGVSDIPEELLKRVYRSLPQVMIAGPGGGLKVSARKILSEGRRKALSIQKVLASHEVCVRGSKELYFDMCERTEVDIILGAYRQPRVKGDKPTYTIYVRTELRTI